MNCNLGNNLKRLRLAKNIEEQTVNLAEHPHEFYSYINLLVAYLFANENQKALELYLKAEKEFADQALLYAFGTKSRSRNPENVPEIAKTKYKLFICRIRN